MTDFDRKLARAEKFVASLDRIDGFEDRHLYTIEVALECGLKNPASGAAFDALVMLRQLRKSTIPRREIGLSKVL